VTATLSAVVADDEPLGRRGIVARLARSERVRVVAECADGRETVEAVTRLCPDILFLDVRMPDLDGFGVVAALPIETRPHVVFVTAHDRHAVEAFRVRAVDYLVKPVDDERFAEALERAVAAVGRGAGSRTPPAPAFPVRSRGRVTRVPHGEVDWIEAQGDYACLHAGTRNCLVRETMRSLERRLDGRFLRIHRSAIVNVERVRELRSCENGDFRVILEGGAELRLSRTHREAVARLTGRNEVARLTGRNEVARLTGRNEVARLTGR
jgi:two-component system, LytTR family, response regulator